MEVSEVNDIILPEGNFRQATLEDLPLLSKWFCQFSLDATNELIDISIASSFMKDKISHGLVYIFENKNKQAVSMAAATRQLQNGICINLVYTDEAFRKKKYGSAVVFNLSKLLLQSGNKFCTLCVDKSNQISNRIYRKIGYKYLIIVMIFDLINITIGKEMVRYPLLCHANFIIDFIIFSYLFPHMVVFLIHSYKQVLLSYLH